MTTIKKVFLWFRILSKRWMKHPLFWALLLMVPGLVFGIRLAAEQDSGIVTVALAIDKKEVSGTIATDSTIQDDTAEEIIHTLMSESSILRFISCSTAEEARTLVQSSRVDAAWIFPEDISARMEDLSGSTPVVEILEQNRNSLLQLSHEKLFLTLYPYLGENLFREFAYEITGELPEVSDHDPVIPDRFIQFSTIDGEESPITGIDYLVMPIRGILAMLLVISAIASAMYYQKDKANECFVWCQQEAPLAFLYHSALLLYLEAAIYGALILAGLAGSALREILLLLLYGLCCMAFAEVLRYVLHTLPRLGAALPVLTIAMLALCPIFFNPRQLRFAQMLLPPYYYLNAIYNNSYITGMVVYTMILLLIRILLRRLQKQTL